MSAGPAIAGANLKDVALVSGQTIQVQGDDEVRWFENTRDRYLAETKFTEATDLRDLDRLLVLELMVYRWTIHLAAGVDYDGNITNDEQLRKNIKEYSLSINQVKAAMGMSKSARDEAADKGNFSEYLTQLRARAKIFGVHREKQLTKALALMNELSAVLGAYDRSDVQEREKLGFESDAEVLGWIREVMLPEYRALDEYFRMHQQRYWVRDN